MYVTMYYKPTGVTKEDITLAKFEAELAEIAGIGAPIEPNAPIAGGGEDSDRKPSPDPEACVRDVTTFIHIIFYRWVVYFMFINIYLNTQQYQVLRAFF